MKVKPDIGSKKTPNLKLSQPQKNIARKNNRAHKAQPNNKSHVNQQTQRRQDLKKSTSSNSAPSSASSGVEEEDYETADSSIETPDDQDEKQMLEKEILALGGNKEDMQLIGDILSDSDEEAEENDDKSSIDPDLEQDFKDLLKTLKIKPFEDDKKKAVSTPNSTKDINSKFSNENSTNKQKKKSAWIIDPTPVWYAVQLSSPPPKASTEVSSSLKAAALKRGQALLEKEANIYYSEVTGATSSSAKLSKNTSFTDAADNRPIPLNASDRAFFSNIINSGTSSDRLSALTLIVSASPIHSLIFLKQLMASAKKKSREEATRAMRAITDWLRGDESGGLPNRKLHWFTDQPGLNDVAAASKYLLQQQSEGDDFEYDNGNTSAYTNGKGRWDDWLILWAFEHWLKQWYFDLLSHLEVLSHDPLVFIRKQAVAHFYLLLRDKPEQEQNLLRLLTNKLGDPEGAIASKASYHLLEILQPHPLMKQIIVSEISECILRPVSTKTSVPSSLQKSKNSKSNKESSSTDKIVNNHQSNIKYYGITTLNQILLRKTEDEAVAQKLIQLYFEVFNDVLRDGDPTATIEEEQDKSKKESRSSQKRKRNSKTATDNKKLAADVSKKISGGGGNDVISDDILLADGKILAAILTGIKRAYPFANLGNEALQERVELLFRVIHSGPFNVSIQALALIAQLAAQNSDMRDRYYRSLYATLIDPRLLTSSKQALYLHLLFNSLNNTQENNIDHTTLAAFVKRIFQVLSLHDTPFVVATLELVTQLLVHQPSLKYLLSPYKDTGGSKEHNSESTQYVDEYDSSKRDPKHAKAETSYLWELDMLLSHYHPTISFYAKNILNWVTSPSDFVPISQMSQETQKSGKKNKKHSTTSTNQQHQNVHINLSLHTLAHFLDRFVYRNPKKIVKDNGEDGQTSSVMGRKELMKKLKYAKENDLGVWHMSELGNKSEDNVPADRLFLHRFFSQKSERKPSKLTTKWSKDDSDDEDEDEVDTVDVDIESGNVVPKDDDDSEEDSEEEEIWKAMQKTMPDKDILGDEDVDDSFGEDDDDDDDDEDDEEIDDDDEAENDMLDEADSDLISLSDVDFDQLEKSNEEDAKEDDDEDEDDQKRAKKKRRKMMKSLPTFADASSYAHLVDGDEDET